MTATTTDIQRAAEHYAKAMESGEIALKRLNQDRDNERLRIRTCRAMRICERWILAVKMYVEIGTP